MEQIKQLLLPYVRPVRQFYLYKAKIILCSKGFTTISDFNAKMNSQIQTLSLSISLYLSVADSASQTLLGSFRSVQKTQMGQNNKSMEILGLIYGKRQKVIGFGLNFMFFWGKLQFFYQFFLENVNILPRFAKF